MFWDTQNNVFGFQVKLDRLSKEVFEKTRLPTKREMLCFLMSIYDPLGLVANKLVQGKILLQELHKATVEWDEAIPCEFESDWICWLESISSFSDLKIERCVASANANAYELHIFVDASEKAY